MHLKKHLILRNSVLLALLDSCNCLGIYTTQKLWLDYTHLPQCY